jgi:hypothetical protein
VDLDSKKKRRNCAHYKKRRYEPRGLEVKILEVLARKDKSWPSEISRETEVTLRAVRLALRRLLKERMVRHAGEEEYGAKFYELTTYGLFMAFYYQEQRPLPVKEDFPLWKEIDRLAEVHGTKIPLVLGKWDYFKRRGVRGSVFKSLCRFFVGPNMPYIIFYQERGEPEKVLKNLGIDPFQKHVESLVKKLTRQILFPKPTPELVPKENGGQTFILIKDPDLKEFINNEITNRQEYHQAELNKLRSWKSFIEKAAKTN